MDKEHPLPAPPYSPATTTTKETRSPQQNVSMNLHRKDRSLLLVKIPEWR